MHPKYDFHNLTWAYQFRVRIKILKVIVRVNFWKFKIREGILISGSFRLKWQIEAQQLKMKMS